MNKLILALLLVATSAMAQEPVCPACPEGMICTPKPVEPPTPTEGTKWHPGHYAESQPSNVIPQFVINDIANVKAIRGVTQRYSWSVLEPKKGEYDFRPIMADLAKLRPHNKRLIVLVMDRSWSGPSTKHLPAYLGSGIMKHPLYGVNAAIWRPEVMERLIALDWAMALTFDQEPLFEGVRYEEITPGMTPGATGVPKDFTVPNMVREWKRLAVESKRHWKRTNVFFNTNSLGGVSGPLEIIEAAWREGVGVGGPDVIPPGANDYQLHGDRVIARNPSAAKKDKASQFVRDYRGEIPIAYSVQTPELGGKEGTFYPQQLADYALGQQRATHMSWVVAPSTVKVNWRNHILPYLSANPRPTVQSCPKRYVGCVTE